MVCLAAPCYGTLVAPPRGIRSRGRKARKYTHYFTKNQAIGPIFSVFTAYAPYGEMLATSSR